MKTKDLLTPQQLDILKQARQSAHQMLEIVTKLVGAGMPYNEHKEKAQEQVMFLDKFNELFGLDE